MEDENLEEQARIMFEMSKLHGKMGNRGAQAERLHVASKILRIDGEISPDAAELEYEILEELKHVRHTIAAHRVHS
jgi:hypothetical protein